MTMTPTQYDELVETLGGRVSSIRTRAGAAAKAVAEENAEALIEYAISNLPNKTYLNYVDRNDEFSVKQVADAIDRGPEALWDSLIGWTDESEWESTKEYFKSALPRLDSDVVDALIYMDEFEDFRTACMERDDSDLIGDLFNNSGRFMFRLNLRACSRIKNLDTGDHRSQLSDDRDWYFESSTWMDAEDLMDAAELILDSIMADGDESRTIKDKTFTNRQNAYEIIVNASSGGNPCLLIYIEPKPLYEALNKIRYNTTPEEKETASLTVKVSDPQYLIYDGLNGSGFEDTIYGNFELTIPFKKIADAFYLDHRDAGTGYSWSEDIAGVHKPCFEQDPEYGFDPPNLVPEEKEVA